MKLVTFAFDRKRGQFADMLKVWERSAAEAMPNVPREIVRMEKPEYVSLKHDMTAAFIAACDYALASDEPLIICDADLMFTGDITDGFCATPLSFTVRAHRHRFNSGVWFYQPTDTARMIVSEWKRITQQIAADLDEYIEDVGEHGGIDQAAQSKVYALYNEHIQLLPCCVYNAEQSCWRRSKHAQVIHIKSRLRDLCLGKREPEKGDRYLMKLVERWRGYLRG